MLNMTYYTERVNLADPVLPLFLRQLLLDGLRSLERSGFIDVADGILSDRKGPVEDLEP